MLSASKVLELSTATGFESSEAGISRKLTKSRRWRFHDSIENLFYCKAWLKTRQLEQKGVHGKICGAFLDSGSPPPQKFLKEQTVLAKDKEFWSFQRVLHR